MIRPFTPPSMSPPLANYSHVSEVPAGTQLYVFSGQLGVAADGSIPEGVAEQAEVIFENLKAGLAACGMDFSNVVRLSTFVADRTSLGPYMAVRDRYVASPPPASTLLVVSGFSRPEFKIEIEIIAGK